MKRDVKRRIAGAPISWGVCEVPGWGCQLTPERVLKEAYSLGLAAMESGPPGFLPDDPEATSKLLGEYDMALLGGFVTAILHDEALREAELAAVERRAKLLEAGGAEVLVLAAVTGLEGYDEAVELEEPGLRSLFDGIARIEEIAESRGLTVAVHPHFGTLIERARHVERLLEGSDAGLCLDTGHLAVGGADPVEVAREYAGRVELVHLKDVDLNLSNAVAAGTKSYAEAVREGMYRPSGAGDVDLESIIGFVEGGGYGGWYVLEQDVMLDSEPEGEGPLADVRKSLEFVETRLGANAASSSYGAGGTA
ncbi:MAG: sugar phosphate isomerase/epimerase family protein [Rubrobacteraceae bacterium]|jgi:inosose dehydratase